MYSFSTSITNKLIMFIEIPTVNMRMFITIIVQFTSEVLSSVKYNNLGKSLSQFVRKWTNLRVRIKIWNLLMKLPYYVNYEANGSLKVFKKVPTLLCTHIKTFQSFYGVSWLRKLMWCLLYRIIHTVYKRNVDINCGDHFELSVLQ